MQPSNRLIALSRYCAHGTGGPTGEIPPSGNEVTLRFATVMQIRDGKLVCEHLYFDQLEFQQQIGAMPS